MVSLSWSRVPWYSKNWLILKIQPSGSVPSNRGTSNFIWWIVVGVGVGEGKGEGLGEVCDGAGPKHWISSSILRVMVLTDSPRYMFWLVSQMRASSRQSEGPECLSRSCILSMKAPNGRGANVQTGFEVTSSSKNSRKERKGIERKVLQKGNSIIDLLIIYTCIIGLLLTYLSLSTGEYFYNRIGWG